MPNGRENERKTATPGRTSGKFWKRIHLPLACMWFSIGIASVTVAPFIQNSIAFLVFCSIYANFIAHMSNWQAARIEEAEDMKVNDEL